MYLISFNFHLNSKFFPLGHLDQSNLGKRHYIYVHGETGIFFWKAFLLGIGSCFRKTKPNKMMAKTFISLWNFRELEQELGNRKECIFVVTTTYFASWLLFSFSLLYVVFIYQLTTELLTANFYKFMSFISRPNVHYSLSLICIFFPKIFT